MKGGFQDAGVPLDQDVDISSDLPSSASDHASPGTRSSIQEAPRVGTAAGAMGAATAAADVDEDANEAASKQVDGGREGALVVNSAGSGGGRGTTNTGMCGFVSVLVVFGGRRIRVSI